MFLVTTPGRALEWTGCMEGTLELKAPRAGAEDSEAAPGWT